MATHAADQVTAAAAAAAAGTKAPPLRRLQDVVRSQESLAEYLDWSSSPFGALAVGALRDLALWGPPSAVGSDVAVQHGITLGLSLAARLLEDPSAVIGTPAPRERPPEMDFGTSAADALDAMM